MNNMMSYGGYTGHFEYNKEFNIYHGELIGIRDVITFEGRNIDELQVAIKDSVEDYLETCKEMGKSPDKPFSLTLSPEVYNKAEKAAASVHKSVNSWIIDVVENNLAP